MLLLVDRRDSDWMERNERNSMVVTLQTITSKELLPNLFCDYALIN